MREIQIKWEDLNSFKQDEILKDALDVAVENFLKDTDKEVVWQDGHYLTGLTEAEEYYLKSDAQIIVLRSFEFPPIINLE